MTPGSSFGVLDPTILLYPTWKNQEYQSSFSDQMLDVSPDDLGPSLQFLLAQDLSQNHDLLII
jgi:hypothetical protein